MELRHLRYFLVLAQRLSFTQAAYELHVTQSTLSHQIQQLEAELGHRLFDRTNRRVCLNQTGELFLGKVIKALAEIDSGISLISAERQPLTGSLSIGTTMTLNMGFASWCIAKFSLQHPTVRINVDEHAADKLILDLRDGILDVVLAYRPPMLEDLVFEPLYSEEMVAVVNPDHALASRKRIRMVELHRRELVLPPRRFTTRVQIDEAFKLAAIEPIIVVETSSIAGMLAIVQHAPFVAIASRSALSGEQGLRAIALEGPSMTRSPGLIWEKGRERTPEMASFASIVRAAAADQRDAPETVRRKAAARNAIDAD